MCNTYGILYDCNTRAKVSEVPLMYCIVALVTGLELTLVWVLESALLWGFCLTIVRFIANNIIIELSHTPVRWKKKMRFTGNMDFWVPFFVHFTIKAIAITKYWSQTCLAINKIWLLIRAVQGRSVSHGSDGVFAKTLEKGNVMFKMTVLVG